MKLDKNICFRIDRDVKQIEEGKKILHQNISFLKRNAKIHGLLGNQVRLSIVLLLLIEGRLCVCDISEILEMKIPAISQHLRKLRDGGIIIAQREGTLLYNSIEKDYLPSIENLFSFNIEKNVVEENQR